jgi:hypothetical protein
MWIYGSGFPKSHNIGKAIDKLNGQEPIEIGKARSGKSSRAYQSEEKTTSGEYSITKANNEWDGWGTALKPANEPLVVARKPLEKGLTIAENVVKWGTGALNIDESRIAGDMTEHEREDHLSKSDSVGYGSSAWIKKGIPHAQGRWPANVLFDEVTGCASWSRFFYIAKASKSERNRGCEGLPIKEVHRYGSGIGEGIGEGIDPHAPSKDKNFHPTVKPIKLMQYLIKLVTPPKGTVLDPFMGSGSTCVAAKELGFKFIGIELSKEYFEIAKARIGA